MKRKRARMSALKEHSGTTPVPPAQLGLLVGMLAAEWRCAMMQTRVMRWIVIATVALALLTLSVPVVGAQSGGAYTLTWNTLDGGGGASTGGSYALVGTIGQADAGALSGGNYMLAGGFWANLPSGLLQEPVRIFLPFVRK